MKRHLLITTAMVGSLALAGGTASAAEWDVSVGGYYNQYVGYAGGFDDANGNEVNDLDVQEDGEIYVSPEITLDNGIKFGAQIQLEAATSTDQIDENYLFVRGSFGEILLGSEDGAGYSMHYGVASNGIGLDDGDAGNWIGGVSGALLSTYNYAIRDDDAQKIRWISERYSGFQVGVSYAPEGRQDVDGRIPNEANNDGVVAEQIFQAGLNYEGNYGDTTVAASVGGQLFGDVNGTSRDDAFMITGGLQIGFGAFTLSLAASHENEPEVGTADRQVYGGSVGYASGPMAISLAAMYGTQEAVGGGDADQVSVELGGSYALGPGVAALGSIYYVNLDNGAADSSGYAVVGGIALSF